MGVGINDSWGKKIPVNKFLFSASLSVLITYHLIPRRHQFAVGNVGTTSKQKRMIMKCRKPLAHEFKILL